MNTTKASNEYHVLALLVRQRGGADYAENLHLGIPVPAQHVPAALDRLADAGLVYWHEPTGSWRAATHAAATLDRIDRDLARCIDERAQINPGTWDANVADLADRMAIERDRIWAEVLADLPTVPQVGPGSILLMPEGHQFENELAVVVESRGDRDAGEVMRWVCRVWAPGTDCDGERVSISQSHAAELAADPLHHIATGAAVMKLGHRLRDEAIRAAGDTYSQHTIAAWAGMSQPGVRNILGGE